MKLSVKINIVIQNPVCYGAILNKDLFYILMDEKEREKYLRVTQILYPFSGLQNVDKEILNHAACRGSRVHKICEAIVSGMGDYGVDSETLGYVLSFKHWWGSGRKVIEIERRFWSDEHKITGQIDMIVETDEGLAIVDIKTSSKPSKTWQLQGSAYYELVTKAGFDIKKIFFLHLNKDGKPPKVIEYQPDFGFFLNVLKVYNYFFAT